MSAENPLWGAPRIHGELLSSALRSLSPASRSIWSSDTDRPPLGGATSCVTMRPIIAAMDLFIAPTIGFDLFYVLVIIRLERRKLVWIITRHPTAEWIARQVTEAFPWAEAPRYLIRDRDRVYGAAVTHRLRSRGIRDKPMLPAASPERVCRTFPCRAESSGEGQRPAVPSGYEHPPRQVCSMPRATGRTLALLPSGGSMNGGGTPR